MASGSEKSAAPCGVYKLAEYFRLMLVSLWMGFCERQLLRRRGTAVLLGLGQDKIIRIFVALHSGFKLSRQGLKRCLIL